MAWLDRCLVAVAVSTLLGGMAVSSWTQRGARGLRDELAAFVAQVDAEELAFAPRHDAVWGETQEGSAFAHYQAAAAVQKLCKNLCWNSTRGVAMADNEELVGEALAARRAQWRPVVEAVVAGAHRRDRTPRHGSEFAMPLAWGLSAEVCARLADGDASAAVQLWLDVMTMHADIEPTGSFLGWWMAGNTIAIWDDARLARLGAAERDLLDRGLQRLELRVDVTPSPVETIASFLRPLLDGTAAGKGWSMRERLWAWQSGMDPGRWHLEGFAELVAAAPLLSPASSAFAERQEQWKRFQAAPRARGTYISGHADERLRALESSRRGVLTNLRLLRLAAAFHGGGALPELADPFADAPLQVAGDAECVLLASAGGRKRYVRRVR